jgi:hypothetical protein
MRTRTTHKQHIKQNKHTSHHRYYTYFFNNGGHPKGRLWMMKGYQIFEQGGIRIFLNNNKTKTKGVSVTPGFKDKTRHTLYVK